MFNILSGEFYKLRKSKSFYFCILAAAAFTVLLYLSLLMVDKINQGEVQNGTGGITVSMGVEEQEAGVEESMMVQIGIIGVLQQMFSGHFVGIFVAIFVSIFAVSEYGNGAIKNIVGKGYSRETVFLSKFLSSVTASIIMNVVIAVLTILIGLPFMGKTGIQATVWSDIVIYLAIQLVLGIAMTGIIVVISEFTRSLGAGIAVSLGVMMLSTTLTAGLDLLCHNFNFKPSEYWILDVMSSCPTMEFGQDYIIRAIVVSVVWFFLAAIVGTLHFKKADVK